MSKANPNKKTLNGPGGIRIVLDKAEVIPDDPGQGTPAMVYLLDKSATYWCASGEGEVTGNRGTRQLTPEQCKWLNDQEDAVTEFLYPKETA